MIDLGDMDVYLGLNVGNGEHHGHALTPTGKKVLDKRLPNSEPKLRSIFDKLTAKHGTVLVVVDQPASIGAPPPAVARDAGCKVARDAAIIADAARTMCSGDQGGGFAPHPGEDLARGLVGG